MSYYGLSHPTGGLVLTKSDCHPLHNARDSFAEKRSREREGEREREREDEWNT